MIWACTRTDRLTRKASCAVAPRPHSHGCSGWCWLTACILATACGQSFNGEDVSEEIGSKLFPDLTRIAVGAEQARIGGNDAGLVPIPAFPGAPPFLAIARDGTIAVVQHQDNAVRFFSASGKALGIFGQNGEGPGEFRNIGRLGWRADTLWVWDVQLRRLTLIGPDRELVRTILVRVDPLGDMQSEPSARKGFRAYGLGAIFPDGSVLAYGETNHERWPMAYFRLTADGVPAKLITPVSDRAEIERTVYSTPSRVMGVDPFRTGTVHTVTTTGNFVIVVRTTGLTGDTDTLQITGISAIGGDTVIDRNYAFRGEPIPGNVVDSVLQRAWRDDPEAAKLFREHAYIPAVYPPAVSATAAFDGTVWVQLTKPSGHAQQYLVQPLSADVTAKLVSFPSDIAVAAVRGNSIWTIETVEYDVQNLVRFRLDEHSGLIADR